MLSRASWLPLTEGLEPGRRLRVNHDCGPGNTLLISRDSNGYRAYCFRCDDSGSARGPQESLATRIKRLELSIVGDREISGQTTAPTPSVRAVEQWPEAARLWMYRAGLGRAEIGRLGAYYHEPSQRVVLPVYSNSELVFWQARALDGRTPKYLNPPVDRSTILPRYGKAEVPTLCEDILSAFKVGLVAEGWSLMGVKPSDRLIAELMRRGRKVNVWLDPDPPGQKAASRICKSLRGLGFEARNIVSAKDPKLHTREQIKELLC